MHLWGKGKQQLHYRSLELGLKLLTFTNSSLKLTRNSQISWRFFTSFDSPSLWEMNTVIEDICQARVRFSVHFFSKMDRSYMESALLELYPGRKRNLTANCQSLLYLISTSVPLENHDFTVQNITTPFTRKNQII